MQEEREQKKEKNALYFPKYGQIVETTYEQRTTHVSSTKQAL